MLEILIVDDNTSKQESIKKSLNECGISFENIKIACCIKEAKICLMQERFDLMILDLVLPIEADGDADAKHGAKLLETIPMTQTIKSPLHIVGLSGFNDKVSEYDKQFKEKLWNLISYEEDSYEWQDRLNSIVQHLIKVRQEFLNASLETQFDVLFDKLKNQNYPVAFLGHDWKTICKSIIDIVERSLDVPSKFSNATKAKNINVNTIKLTSEYDFQNLIHLVLRPWLPSIEAENIAIIFDGSSKIADFSINANSIIIEAKHIKDTNTRNNVMKTIEGLKTFYQNNANVKSLIFLLLVDASVDIDKYKIENEFSILTKEPYVFVSVIGNKIP